MIVGGIILSGGKSRRMGEPKEWLTLGGEPMLCRVAQQLGEVVNPIVVVAAEGQALPFLPPQVLIAHDARPDRGPLEGLRAGLQALAAQTSPALDAAFVVSCDVPLLRAAFIRRMIDLLDDSADAAVPDDGQRLHPLAGVYRLSVLKAVDGLLATDQRRLRDLCAAIRTRRVPTAELRDVDPNLASLINVNCPEELTRARSAYESATSISPTSNHTTKNATPKTT